jgi:hypothetical protein
MGICKKKYTWNNLLAISRMTLALFVTLRNLFMVLSKLPELGMPKWTTFLLTLDFLDAILILMSIPRKKEAILIILVLDVDDLILNGSDSKLLNHVKTSLKNKFEMTDLGFLHYFLASKFCKPMKEFFFPSLSMLVNLFFSFTWKIVNQPLLPSSLESSLLPPILLLEVDATLYH